MNVCMCVCVCVCDLLMAGHNVLRYKIMSADRKMCQMVLDRGPARVGHFVWSNIYLICICIFSHIYCFSYKYISSIIFLVIV